MLPIYLLFAMFYAVHGCCTLPNGYGCPILYGVNACPMDCVCYDSVANCSYRKITIPDRCVYNNTKIDLSYNHICIIYVFAFASNTVTEINLSNNMIYYIYTQAFDCVPQLSKLDLSYNEITYLASEVFGISPIYWLSLSGNKDIFITLNMTTLTTLYLKDCNLENFNMVNINNTSLSMLDLSNNCLKEMPYDLLYIQTLNLTNNHLPPFL